MSKAASDKPEVMVVLPRALLNLFPGSVQEVDLSASTVGDMMDALDEKWPGMRDRLCDSTPSIRRHLNVFVRGQRATLETRLSSGAKIYVLTAMSGG